MANNKRIKSHGTEVSQDRAAALIRAAVALNISQATALPVRSQTRPKRT
jgi:hypothetical protein